MSLLKDFFGEGPNLLSPEVDFIYLLEGFIFCDSSAQHLGVYSCCRPSVKIDIDSVDSFVSQLLTAVVSKKETMSLCDIPQSILLISIKFLYKRHWINLHLKYCTFIIPPFPLKVKTLFLFTFKFLFCTRFLPYAETFLLLV